MIESYHTPEASCANCGEQLDVADSVTGGRAPEPGDISVCFYCHHVMIYDQKGKPRNPTDEEIVEMAGDPEFVHAMTMLGKFKQWEEGRKNAQANLDNRAARRASKPR